jgi:PAS domain S-box-containing protein
MKNTKPTYGELEKKLAAAEKFIARIEKNKTASTKGEDTATGKRNTVLNGTHDLAEAYITSEQNFKNSMDASPLGIRIITEDGELIYANKAILDICGYKTAEELAAVPRNQLYTPESYKTHLERKRKRKLKEYVPLEYEIDIRRPDGEVRNLQVFRREVIWGGEQQFMAMYQDITEHVWSLQALRESEEKFHTIVEHGNDGIVFVQDGIVQYCNSKMLELGDFTEREVLGKPFLNFVAPEHKEKVFDIYNKRIAGKKTQQRYDLNLMGKSGKKVYVEVSASLTSYKQNQVDIAIVRDVTERKKVEEALADEVVRRRILVEQSRDGIVILEQDGKVYEANQRFADMLGYSMDELQQLHVFDWEFQYPHQQVVEMLRTVDEKGDHFETQHRRKDGTTYNVEISTNGATFAGQKLIFCVCRDITERKQAEEAIKESEERFRTLFETMAQGVIYHDAKGKVISSNPAAQRILGLTLDEMIGKTSLNPQRRRLHEDGSALASEEHPSIVALRTGKSVNDVIMAVYNPIEKDYRWIINHAIPEFKEGGKTPYRVFTTFTDITERRKMQGELERDRAEIKLIIDSLTALVFYKDKEGKLLRVNKAFAEALNMSEEDFIGKTVFDLYSADIAQNMADDDREVFASRHPKLNIIEQYESATGIRWVQTDKVPVLDKNGEPVAMIGFAQDITIRKQAEEAIKESEEKFNKAFHASLNLMAIISLDEGQIIDVNEAYCKSIGYNRKELIGHTALDINLWANPQQRKEFYRTIANEGRLENKEVFLRTKTGEIRTYLFSAEKITLGGTPSIVIGALDITERKQAEQRINHLNQTLRSIRNVNQLITREKDRDKLLKGVCDTLVESRSFFTAWIVLLDEAYKPVAYAVSGTRGDFSKIIEDFNIGKLPLCVQKALDKAQVVTIQDPKTMCVGCPNLHEYTNFGSMTVRLEYAGKSYGVLCTSLPKEILTDKNEVSLFEEVAADIAFALYNMEREAEYKRLEQERLRAAKLESIGTLAGGIAHDFNNLLTGIMGNIGLVKSYISPSENNYEMLDEAEKAALRAKDLTQQLLTFARGGKPVKKPVIIADIVQESANFALRGSKVKLELSLPEVLWPVEADEGQISQVINNLVINADEAMPLGGTLKIQVENLSLKKTTIPLLPPGNYIRIDIVDAGIGMSPENLQRIFEPYFTTKQRGSGLGLTSAYSIVKNHGGIIFVDSRLNKGSTFHVYLPATQKSMKVGKKMKKATSGQAGGKVLVMDDQEIIRKMLKNMLSLAGYIVELSADGAEAIEKYQQAMKIGDPFNAVIMDLTIPGGMGGREAVEKLLEIDPYAKVIVSSGYATDAIMSDFKNYGFKAVIAKPYSVKQLQDTLSNLLTGK